MLSIYSKDTLRASVESLSNGQVTVLYNDLGYPQFMTILEAFKMKDFFGQQYSDFNAQQIAYYESIIGPLDDYHPAFTVDGTVKSHIFVGTFANSITDGYASSLPNRQVAVRNTLAEHRNACIANGSRWRIMNNLEWSALFLKAFLRNTTMYQNVFNAFEGNNPYSMLNLDDPFSRLLISYDFGLSDDDSLRYSLKYGVPELDMTSFTTRTLTGTGGLSWTFFGVADFLGNVRQIVDGVKMRHNRYYAVENNVLDFSDVGTWTEFDAYINQDTTSDALQLSTVQDSTSAATDGEFWLNDDPVNVSLVSGASKLVDIALGYYGDPSTWHGVETAETTAHTFRRQLLDPMGAPFLFKSFRDSAIITQETLKFESMFENMDITSISKLAQKFIGTYTAVYNDPSGLAFDTYLTRGGPFMIPGHGLEDNTINSGKLLSTHFTWDGETISNPASPVYYNENCSRLVYIP